MKRLLLLLAIISLMSFTADRQTASVNDCPDYQQCSGFTTIPCIEHSAWINDRVCEANEWVEYWHEESNVIYWTGSGYGMWLCYERDWTMIDGPCE